jgi:16S rRNA G527 N7-methylase RsmG
MNHTTEIMMLPEMNELWQQTLNWQPDQSQQQQFQRLYELIVEGHRSLNLTRITEPVDCCQVIRIRRKIANFPPIRC